MKKYYRVNGERNTLRTIKRRKEERKERRIKVTGRRGRRRKQLLNDLKETRGYWKLKEEALDSTL